MDATLREIRERAKHATPCEYDDTKIEDLILKDVPYLLARLAKAEDVIEYFMPTIQEHMDTHHRKFCTDCGVHTVWHGEAQDRLTTWQEARG